MLTLPFLSSSPVACFALEAEGVHSQVHPQMKSLQETHDDSGGLLSACAFPGEGSKVLRYLKHGANEYTISPEYWISTYSAPCEYSWRLELQDSAHNLKLYR
jgi:hypothetical protein